MGETQIKEMLEKLSGEEIDQIYQLVKTLHDNPAKEKPRNYRQISAMLTGIRGDMATTVIDQRHAAL